MDPAEGIVCPFPLRLHPDTDLIEADAERWAADLGWERYRHQRTGWLGCACHPYGEPAAVLVATNVLQWIFWFDDLVDVTIVDRPWLAARQAQLSVRVVEDPEHPVKLDDEPCLAALDDIARRLRRMCTQAQYQRFVAGLTEWVFGELAGVVAGADADPADYSTQRRYNTNGLICYGLIDTVAGVELPESLWQRPDVRALTRIAADIMGYTNDVDSWRRELAGDPGAVNLPVVIAREHQLGLPEAVVLAADHVCGLYGQFQDGVAQLRGTDAPALDAYLYGLETWLSGQHHWSRTNYRHQVEEP